jgi:hypothetical protein
MDMLSSFIGYSKILDKSIKRRYDEYTGKTEYPSHITVLVGIVRANRGRFRKSPTVNPWTGHPWNATGDCGMSKTKKRS